MSIIKQFISGFKSSTKTEQIIGIIGISCGVLLIFNRLLKLFFTDTTIFVISLMVIAFISCAYLTWRTK